MTLSAVDRRAFLALQAAVRTVVDRAALVQVADESWGDTRIQARERAGK